MSLLSKLFFVVLLGSMGRSALGAEQYMVVDLDGTAGCCHCGVSYLSVAPEGGWSDEYKTSKIVLRRVEPGTFDMGDHIHGGPLYKNIRITVPYYIGVFEITQRQWELIQGTRPSFFAEESSYETRPVEMVSYDMIRGSMRGANWPNDNAVDEDSFLGVLRTRSGVEFDLPTEAQWEFACRAGTTNDYNNGEQCAIYGSMAYYSEDTNLNSVARYYYNGSRCWVDCGQPSLGLHDYNSDTTVGTAKVGSYLPNALGIYDMHGNVDEWCRDWLGPLSEGSVDPIGAAKSTLRVIRGGDWYYYAKKCVSFARDDDRPECVSYKYSTHGFRIAVAVKQQRIKFDVGPEGRTPDDLYVESGCVLGNLPITERYGYSFIGWFAEADGGVPYTTESIMPAHDLHLTARWEKKRFTVVFAPGLGMPDEQITREYLDEIGNMPTPVAEGRDFYGWFTKEEGGALISEDEQVSADMTLYAHWAFETVVDGRTWRFVVEDGGARILPPEKDLELLNVPIELNGIPVREIPDACFANCSNLTSVTLPSSITNIGAYAFYNCVNLKDVVFNEGLISIGDGAFAKCESIEKVTLPSTVGSIGSRLAIVNPVAEVSEKSETHYSFETNYVDDARCARELRSSQDETVCSACNTGRGVFECCLSLKEVELNEGLESIGAGAFKGCKDLAGLVIPDNVSSIGGLAETLMKSTRESSSSAYDLLQEEGGQPSVLTSEHIISDACSSCEHVDSGFLEGCSALCSVKLPKCLKYLGPNSFAGCSRLTFVELPDSLTVINRGTFSRCKKLIRIKFPENLELIGGDELPYSIREASHYDAAWANGKELPLIISDSVIISTNGVVIDSATSQGQKMPDIEREVEDCRWLADPQGVRIQVDEAAFEEWFYRWKGAKVLMDVACPLTDDELNKVRMEFASVRPTEPSFESLDNGVFYGCSSLREVCLPQSVRRIADYSFYDCCNLVKIELPKRLDMLGYQVFGGETALKDIATPWFNFCSLWEIFPSHSYVTNLVILSSPPDLMDPNDVFKAVMKDVRGEAFTLEEANARMVPLSDDERRQVGRKILEDLWITQDEVLYGFWNLKSLTLPEGLRSFDWTIGWWSTQKLLDVTLPNTLAGLGLRALAGFALEHIAIPSSLQTMEDEVFLESNVDDVLFMGNAPCDVSANVFVDASGWDPDYAAREDLVINVYPGTFGWGGDFESATLPTDGLWPAHAAIYKRRPIQFVRQPVSVALGGEGAADALTYFDAAVNRLVTVPQTWLNSYGLLFVDAVGAADVANLSPIVSRTLYDSYVAGLDPTDEESQFKVKIEIVNNEPVVSWEPELSPEEAAKRKYTIYGCTELGGEWHKVEDVSAESRPQFRFFKVGVEMK